MSQTRAHSSSGRLRSVDRAQVLALPCAGAGAGQEPTPEQGVGALCINPAGREVVDEGYSDLLTKWERSARAPRALRRDFARARRPPREVECSHAASTRSRVAWVASACVRPRCSSKAAHFFEAPAVPCKIHADSLSRRLQALPESGCMEAPVEVQDK